MYEPNSLKCNQTFAFTLSLLNIVSDLVWLKAVYERNRHKTWLILFAINYESFGSFHESVDSVSVSCGMFRVRAPADSRLLSVTFTLQRKSSISYSIHLYFLD